MSLGKVHAGSNRVHGIRHVLCVWHPTRSSAADRVVEFVKELGASALPSKLTCLRFRSAAAGQPKWQCGRGPTGKAAKKQQLSAEGWRRGGLPGLAWMVQGSTCSVIEHACIGRQCTSVSSMPCELCAATSILDTVITDYTWEMKRYIHIVVSTIRRPARRGVTSTVWCSIKRTGSADRHNLQVVNQWSSLTVFT